jgi:hypothetical protein
VTKPALRSRASAGADPGPSAPRHWAWVAVPLTVLTAVLFVAYLHVSRTQAVASDGASNALQAWDMLHGNPLLRGWTVTDVSFYTTELPEYMLVEAVRGLNADVLHAAAALSYALLIPLGALLAKGRATGREAVVRMLIAAGIMLAPEPGPGVFILVFQPDHIGTQVPLLLTWLVLDRAPRRWFTPVVIGPMLTWIGVADQIVLITGVIPLVTVCTIRALRRRPAWFELSLAGAAAAAVAAARGIATLLSAMGGYRVLPVGTGVTTPGLLPLHLRLAGQGVLGLYGASFANQDGWLPHLFAIVHLAGLALAATALGITLWRLFRCQDMIAQLLAVAIVVNVAAYLLSAKPSTYWSVREMAGILPAGAVLAGRVLGPRLVRAAFPALAVALAGYAFALGYAASLPPVPANTQDLAGWLAAHHFSYGLSSYGLGNSATLSAGGAVAVRPVVGTAAGISPGPHEYNVTWYDPGRHDADFVVLLPRPAAADPIGAWQVVKVFGRPAHVYSVGQYRVWTWRTNLLGRLGPPAPAS